VISSYQQCASKTVRRLGGLVARYMGDGVLVYFGYPEAHEDDAERAVRAGLDLIAAVVGLNTRAALQARVGIATGLDQRFLGSNHIRPRPQVCRTKYG
jgi:class 3 adenylate cyclase